MSTFFTADQHFGHDKIRALCGRPFETLEEMDEVLIRSWNSRVCPKDNVHILGDFARGNAGKWLSRLNGKKHLILGNHDDRRKASTQHFASVHEARMLPTGPGIWLSHYAHIVWPKSHYGAFHLFGHSHGKLKDNRLRGRQMDVGVDCHNFYPISYDEIAQRLLRIDF